MTLLDSVNRGKDRELRTKPRRRKADHRPAPTIGSRYTGMLTCYSARRNFGFISIDPSFGRRDVFVHASAFTEAGFEPVDTMRLSFVVAENDGRTLAKDLAIVS